MQDDCSTSAMTKQYALAGGAAEAEEFTCQHLRHERTHDFCPSSSSAMTCSILDRSSGDGSSSQLRMRTWASRAGMASSASAVLDRTNRTDCTAPPTSTRSCAPAGCDPAGERRREGLAAQDTEDTQRNCRGTECLEIAPAKLFINTLFINTKFINTLFRAFPTQYL